MTSTGKRARPQSSPSPSPLLPKQRTPAIVESRCETFNACRAQDHPVLARRLGLKLAQDMDKYLHDELVAALAWEFTVPRTPSSLPLSRLQDLLEADKHKGSQEGQATLSAGLTHVSATAIDTNKATVDDLNALADGLSGLGYEVPLGSAGRDRLVENFIVCSTGHVIRFTGSVGCLERDVMIFISTHHPHLTIPTTTLRFLCKQLWQVLDKQARLVYDVKEAVDRAFNEQYPWFAYRSRPGLSREEFLEGQRVWKRGREMILTMIQRESWTSRLQELDHRTSEERAGSTRNALGRIEGSALLNSMLLATEPDIPLPIVDVSQTFSQLQKKLAANEEQPSPSLDTFSTTMASLLEGHTRFADLDLGWQTEMVTLILMGSDDPAPSTSVPAEPLERECRETRRCGRLGFRTSSALMSPSSYEADLLEIRTVHESEALLSTSMAAMIEDNSSARSYSRRREKPEPTSQRPKCHMFPRIRAVLQSACSEIDPAIDHERNIPCLMSLLHEPIETQTAFVAVSDEDYELSDATFTYMATTAALAHSPSTSTFLPAPQQYHDQTLFPVGGWSTSVEGWTHTPLCLSGLSSAAVGNE